MPQGAAEFLAIGGVVVATAGILILGLVIGYRMGLQAAPVVYPATAGDELAPGLQERLHQLAVCRKSVDSVLDRSLALGEAATRHGEAVPRELTLAIERLIEHTRLLADRLHSLSERAGCDRASELRDPRPSPLHDPASPPAASTNPKQESGVMRWPTPGTPQGTSGLLTAEEMQSLGKYDEGQPGDEDVARRRYPYQCQQYVRVCDDGGVAIQDALPVAVWCHDISVGGISFFWPDEPQFERLIISVGSPDCPILMQAEVMQSKVVYMRGEIRHLLGCRFTSRIESVPGGEPVMPMQPATAPTSASLPMPV